MNFINSEIPIKVEENIINNIDVELKVDNFIMDDYNLSTELVFNFDESINEYCNLNNIHSIDLTDLIIRDEENRIIYGGKDKERFEKYCNDNNLNYTFGKADDENYMNCGLNSFISYYNKDSSLIKLMYNIYSKNFPKSKKLNFSFTKIVITENENTENSKISLEGNWNIDLNVPEKMYNRTYEYYKVLSCSNSNFDIYTSKVNETGFEIGIIINNIESPKSSDEFFKNLDNANVTPEEYNKLQEEYWMARAPIDISGRNSQNTISYIENSNLDKFYCTMSPSRKYSNEFLANKKLDFYETFSLTKNEASNLLTLILYYYGEPVEIKLEKIEN